MQLMSYFSNILPQLDHIDELYVSLRQIAVDHIFLLVRQQQQIKEPFLAVGYFFYVHPHSEPLLTSLVHDTVSPHRVAIESPDYKPPTHHHFLYRQRGIRRVR